MNLVAPLPPEAANGLAAALIASSNAPLLLLDGDLKVVAASGSFCRVFEIACAGVPGASLEQIGGILHEYAAIVTYWWRGWI